MICIHNAIYKINENTDINISEYIQKHDYYISKDMINDVMNDMINHIDHDDNICKYVSIDYSINENDGILQYDEINHHINKHDRWCIGFSNIEYNILFPNYYEYNVIDSSCNITQIIIKNENNEEYILSKELWDELIVYENGYIYVQVEWKPLTDPFPNQKKYIHVHYNRHVRYNIKVYELNGQLLKDIYLKSEIPLHKTCMIYHLYPDFNHCLSDLHFYYLNRFKHIFNRIYISVAHQNPYMIQRTEEKILEKLGNSQHICLLRTHNNRHKGEATSFLYLLNHVSSHHDIDYIFYAHSKGLRYSLHDPNIKNIKKWIEFMYIFCISNIDQMINNDANFGGNFIREGFLDNNLTRWHYSGSYYWMNHRMLELRTLIKNPKNKHYQYEYYISERFPGLCCPNKEKCHEFLTFPEPMIDNLYYQNCIQTFSSIIHLLQL